MKLFFYRTAFLFDLLECNERGKISYPQWVLNFIVYHNYFSIEISVIASPIYMVLGDNWVY